MKDIEQILKNMNVYGHKEEYGYHKAFIKLSDCGMCTLAFNSNNDGYEFVAITPTKPTLFLSLKDLQQLKYIMFEDYEEVYHVLPKRENELTVKNCVHLVRPANGKELDELIGD